MANDWGDNILLSHLADEPELSDEFVSIFAALAEKPSRNVVLDFGAVSYLNSSHLAQLLRLRKLLSESGGVLVLCAMNDDTRSVMRLSRLDSLFRFADDPLTALAGLQIEQASGDDTPASA
ncbi:MAG: STAS domain-containing protein [Phycisphaerales bacterium]